MSELTVAVIGAGVVGLTTALQLQKEFPNAQISVLADKFSVQTTSYVAAGLFRPGSGFFGPTPEITKKWINDSFSFWQECWMGHQGPLMGVTQLSGYLFSNINEDIVRNHYIEDIVPIYRRATEDELNLCPGNWKYGSFLTTTLTDCGIYLPWATQTFKTAGGKIITAQIKSLLELSNKYDIIVNCTGLGAKHLCADKKLIPIRGQVIKVDAPFVKTFFYGDTDTYIIPSFTAVTLGGCRQYSSYNLSVCKYDSMAIRERCEALLPSLRSCPTIRELVGLRPHRDPVRVEKETLNCKGTKIKVVHNYGHGGYGVTTAPGTAMYAVKMVREILAGNSKL